MSRVSIIEEQEQKWIEDGYLTVKKYGIVATTPAGREYALTGVLFGDQEKAWQLADKISDHARSNPDWSPEANEHWHYNRTIYGSDAWSQQDEHGLQKADVEAEYGPGEYQPGGPGYLGAKC